MKPIIYFRDSCLSKSLCAANNLHVFLPIQSDRKPGKDEYIALAAVLTVRTGRKAQCDTSS